MTLTGKDASLLALLAEAPAMPSAMRERLTRQLSEPAQDIARALLGENAPADARATAVSIQIWASRNASHAQRRARAADRG